jgi:hypothetical protein
MKPRSPVLGYNHNVRYANRLWHVQTEDSGVQNPHIFTHLFHNGTILATKRTDYDPAAEVPVVQKLMQTQHKTMLRELKAGVYDEKISKYFGEPVVRGASDDGEVASGAFPVVNPAATSTPAASSPAAASASASAAPPPAPPPSVDEDSTVFDPYVPTAMRQERAARGERVTNERATVAGPSSNAGTDTAVEQARADMGSAPTMLAVPRAGDDEGPRFRDTLSTPSPHAGRSPSGTAPRIPTPSGGVRERVPTPLGTAIPRNPTPTANAKPSSTLPPARPPSQPTAARPAPAPPPSQPTVAPPARPAQAMPLVGRPPSQPTMARPTPSSGSPQVGRPSSQPGMSRPPVGGGTTRPAPGRPTPPTTARPGVPPSTVPATQSRANVPAQGTGGIGERRRSPSQPAFAKPTAEGVVVARPAVIIGGESSRAPAPRPPASAVPARWSGDPPPIDPAARPSSDNIFGGDLISEKSLDEVILAYLSEDLNEK